MASAIQRDEREARAVLEQLVEAGLIEAHGVKKGRTCTLSADVNRASGQPAEYVRQAGFDAIQQEQMVLHLARKKGSITRSDLISLCRIRPDQANRLLRKLHSENK